MYTLSIKKWHFFSKNKRLVQKQLKLIYQTMLLISYHRTQKLLPQYSDYPVRLSREIKNKMLISWDSRYS